MGFRTAVRSRFVRLRAYVRKGGAEESGLASVTDLCFLNAAGDALVAVTLASSLFFAVPVGQARGRVALYLLITMAPFTLLAPVLGPMLDRFPHGRRIAIAATMLARAFLAWSLAEKLTDPVLIYPLALGILVMSRAFGVAKSAIVPRIIPEASTLVGANSRLTITGVVAGVVVLPFGYGIGHLFGFGWVLRLCSLVFLGGVLLAFNLPRHVDSPKPGEERAKGLLLGGSRLRRTFGSLPVALRSVSSLRALVGFLTLFLAFVIKSTNGSGYLLGGLAASAAVGSALGTLIGGRLSRKRPELLIVMGLTLGTVSVIGAAIEYVSGTALLAALLATISASMGKLALDATIQRDVDERVRNSTFAKTETVLQLSWCIGGAIGLIPFSGRSGFVLAGACMLVALFGELIALARHRGRARARRSAGLRPAAPPDQPYAGAAAGRTATTAAVIRRNDEAPTVASHSAAAGPPMPAWPATESLTAATTPAAAGGSPGIPPARPVPEPAMPAADRTKAFDEAARAAGEPLRSHVIRRAGPRRNRRRP